MNSRQRHILRILSGICVGSLAFLIVFLLVLLSGMILFGTRQHSAFFSAQDAILVIISILTGLAAAVLVGRRYFRALQNEDRYHHATVSEGLKCFVIVPD